MKTIIDIFLYFLIALAIIQNQLLLAVALVALFTFRVGAVWLIPLAFCLDGYFGAFSQVPLITIYAMIWYGLSELLRPQIMINNNSYGQAS